MPLHPPARRLAETFATQRLDRIENARAIAGCRTRIARRGFGLDRAPHRETIDHESLAGDDLKAKVKPEVKLDGLTFQDLILKLSHFWVKQGCVLQQPYDVEVGAGTMHPETFLRVLGPAPYRVAYVQPSRRPADGRYGENPNRLYKHMQFQVILKPAPVDVQDLYLKSLAAIGIELEGARHSLRGGQLGIARHSAHGESAGRCFSMDWRSPSSRTFSRAAASTSIPSPSRLTYGLERICAFLQDVESVYDLRWSADKTYGDIRLAEEQQFSEYSFDRSDATAHPRRVRAAREAS